MMMIGQERGLHRQRLRDWCVVHAVLDALRQVRGGRALAGQARPGRAMIGRISWAGWAPDQGTAKLPH